MKKILALAAILLGTGLALDARSKDCGSCNTGCAKKTNDCGAVCNRSGEREERTAVVKCPKTVTVYEEVPVTQYREKVTTTCECPAPKVEYTDWSKLSCSSKKCGHCESCKHRRAEPEVVSYSEVNGKSKTDKKADKAGRKADKKAKTAAADKKAKSVKAN